MQRILFLTRLFSPHIGGVETHVWKISKELQKKGYQITVLTEQYEPQLSESENIDGIEVIRIPKNAVSKKLTLWKWILKNRELFKQAEIVHIHDVFWWVIPVLPIISKKYFITFHGWEGTFPIKKSAVFQRQTAANLAKGVIQVGEFIEKWYGTKPDLVTYGGVEVQKNIAQGIFKKIAQAAKLGKYVSVAKPKYSAIFIGRLSADNDIQKVIEFFRIWKKNDSHAEFLFVGDGEFRMECEIVGKVEGFVTDVSKFMNETNVVCANSYLSILEAQSLGKLVCSFYSNPLKRDYLTKYPGAKAMIIEVSPEELFRNVQEFFQHLKELTRNISEVKEWANQQTWQNVAEAYEHLWSKV